MLILKKSHGLFGYLLLLTAIFMMMEISIFIQASHYYLGDYQFISHHLHIPLKVVPSILFFIFSQLLLHLFYTIIIWAMAQLIAIALQCSFKTTLKIAIGLWFVGIMLILLANQYYFPNSKYNYLTQFLFHFYLLQTLLIIFFSLFLLATLLAIRGFFLMDSKLFKLTVLVLIAVGCLIIGHFFYSHSQLSIDAATAAKPNIILIGIDSLRPDFLGYVADKKSTPNLDHFLNQATVFSQSFTPLARTFPAWMSILTGQYPKHSGIRFNLPALKDEKKLWQFTLPSQLRNDGYLTIFSTDETRFSNIDQHMGFDKIITPPMGFNDFLLGTMNDFPMSNLLVNTIIGKFLFPFSYGNRPVFISYDPNTFLQILRNELPDQRTKPMLLAVHFCLPHAPYIWKDKLFSDTPLSHYQSSISGIDQQFKDFLHLLKKKKLLEHSIVVLLSDHGEAFGLSGDRVTNANLFIASTDNKKKIIPHFYPASDGAEQVDQSVGHGTDVLGLTQYHTLLAIRLYGMQPNRTNVISDRVSLLDIKPTVLDFIGKQSAAQDGVSLRNVVLGKDKVVHSDPDFFMESDFSPQAVIKTHPEMRDIIHEGIDYFEIDPISTRITVKNSMAKLILNSKQYADKHGEWILALYPQSQRQMMPILVNLETGRWTNDLHTSFAQQSPASHMLKALRKFYKTDIYYHDASFNSP